MIFADLGSKWSKKCSEKSFQGAGVDLVLAIEPVIVI
jgi:hypothetical protein